MNIRRTAAAVVSLGMLVTACSAGTVGPSATELSPSGTGQQRDAADTVVLRPMSARVTGQIAAPETVRAGWGPTVREIRRARSIASRMPLAKLAGQVIVAQYDGKRPPTRLVNDLHLGGVIVMAGNIGSTSALRRSNRTLQSSATKAGRDWPVFIGVDQEGGVVERVKGGATRFPAFMSAGAARNPLLTRRAAAASGAELRNLGFSVVFAPDADVTSGPGDPTIGSRSAGSRPGLVARQMNAAVKGYRDAGIVPVAKHFPGHGSVAADSHVELPVQRKSLRRLRASDLVPFKAAVTEGAPSVMVAHIDVRAVHPRTPSTLSRKVVTGLLRRDLGFEGLVVSDAMNMGAVTGRHSSGESAVRALAAGVDVVLMPPDPRAARAAIIGAVGSGRLARSRLEAAATRQIALLLHQRAARPTVTKRPGASAAESRRLSAAAATVVSGPCRGRLVGRAVRATGPKTAVANFNAAARAEGLRVGSGIRVALIGYRGRARSAGVVVSTDTPYVLGRSRARVAKIATYGDTPGAMRALVRVLLGKAPAPGRLPVPVRGVQRPGC